jgi:hypothetical protein
LTPTALLASFSVCSSGVPKPARQKLATITAIAWSDTYRTASGVRQRTLLNLGNGFVIAPEQWKALTQRIEQIVLGRQDMLPPQFQEVEREAQNVAALLSRENPRLCRGDSQSLTDPGVHRRDSTS